MLGPGQQWCARRDEALVLVTELMEPRRQVVEFRRALCGLMRDGPTNRD